MTNNNLPKITKNYGKRAVMLGISGFVALLGIIGAIYYVFSMNMLIGAPSVIMLFAGGLTFYYYWSKQKEIRVRHVGDVPTEQVNSLTLYPDIIKFENVNDPEGFIWHCIDDGKPYYVNIWNEKEKRIQPFILPDQQYYDPGVFGQRVLALPAHRKIFTRRADLMQKLKPAIAALVGVGIWILIMTTTGG